VTRASRILPVVAALASTVALALIPAGPAHAAATVRLPDSIDASGARDVTKALNTYFAGLADGSTVELADHGRYHVEGVLRLVNLHGVTIDGNGSELFADTDGSGVVAPAGRYKAHWPRSREHVTVQDAIGLTVRNLSIRGPNQQGGYTAALEGQAGFAIYKSSRVVLDGVSVSRTYGDGVYVAGAAHDVTIRNSTFDTIGRQGVAVVNATNVVIERNRFQKIARTVFDLEPAVPRWVITSVHARDNDVGDFGNFLLAAGGAGPNVSDVWLEHNRVTGGRGIAVFAGMPRWLRHGLHVVDNTSTVDGKQVPGTSRTGVMQIEEIDGVEIRGNQQPVASGVTAVSLVDVCNLTFRDNDFPGAGSDKQQTGKCTPGKGATAPGTSGAGSKGSSKRAGGGTGSAASNSGVKDAKTRKGSTDRDWMVAGLLGGLAVLLILGQQVARKRVQARR
jgi:hypothetical protein